VLACERREETKNTEQEQGQDAGGADPGAHASILAFAGREDNRSPDFVRLWSFFFPFLCFSKSTRIKFAGVPEICGD
jgi:hypothetical protein